MARFRLTASSPAYASHGGCVLQSLNRPLNAVPAGAQRACKGMHWNGECNPAVKVKLTVALPEDASESVGRVPSHHRR
jgi:hypothetical protein